LKILASQGIYISGWHDEAFIPGEGRKSGKSKGIGDLPVAMIRLLRESFEHPETAPKFLLLPSGSRRQSLPPILTAPSLIIISQVY
jgi:hypothetical protein